jgi:phosphomannomutase
MNVDTNVDLSAIAKLFKAYDIRGTCPQIDAKVYYLTGIALVKKILIPERLPTKIAVMRDCRLTSPQFYKALCLGITEAGGEPIPLGIGPTDLLYGACQLFGTPGAMVTASHNPKDDNGLKMVKKIPQMLGLASGLDKIRDYVLENYQSNTTNLDNLPEIEQNDELKNQVLDFMFEKVREIGSIEQVNQKLEATGRKLKIIVDTANGMAGFLMPRLAKEYLNIDFLPMYWELDGEFPNHPADPLVAENLKDLVNAVKTQNADGGSAFDGDGDRCFFVDEFGKPIEGNFIVSVFAKTLLKDYFQNPTTDQKLNPVVVYSQPNGRIIPEVVLENDGIPVPSKQGHTFIKSNMDKYNGLYGGERSGHHYFGTFGSMDSGILSFALMLKILVLENSAISSLVANLNSRFYYSPEINFRLPLETTFENVKEKILKSFKSAQISYLDGITLFFPDWKANLRMSNTEPVLRLSIETRDSNFVNQKVKQIKRVIGLS